MTTLEPAVRIDETATSSGPRLADVARMHTAAWPLIIGWPVAILGLSFLINIVIFSLIPDGAEVNITGGVLSIYGFAVAFYIQAMTQTFPFALGLSVTRRRYYTATMMVALAQAVVFGFGLYLLSLLEDATGGFGVRMRMFDLPSFVTDNVALQISSFVLAFALVDTLGTFFGALYLRWRMNGLFAVFVGAALLLAAFAAVVTWQRWWTNVGRFFTETPIAVLIVVIPVIVIAALVTGGWGLLRRASA